MTHRWSLSPPVVKTLPGARLRYSHIHLDAEKAAQEEEIERKGWWGIGTPSSHKHRFRPREVHSRGRVIPLTRKVASSRRVLPPEEHALDHILEDVLNTIGTPVQVELLFLLCRFDCHCLPIDA